MLQFIDFERIYANPEILAHFNMTYIRYLNRFNDAQAMYSYKDSRKQLKMMIEGAK